MEGMPKFEKIIYGKEVIALIIRKDFKPQGIQFFSTEDYPLQMGAMMRPKGYQIAAHTHNPLQRTIVCTQEALFIQSGEVRVDFYSQEQVFLESRILVPGDIVFFAGAGHGIEFISEAVIFEVKNGPFVPGADKVRFEPKKELKK